MTGPELVGLIVVLTAITATILGTLGWDLRRIPGQVVIAEAIARQAAE
jgi:hypothetical protein